MTRHNPTPPKSGDTATTQDTPVTKAPRKARRPSGDSPAPKPRPQASGSEKKPSRATRFFRRVLMCINAAGTAALVAGAYSGYISPEKFGGYWGLLGLAFPAFLGAMLALFVLQLFVYRKGAAVVLAALVACGGPILDYCPLNLFTPKPTPGAKTLKVMTYNVLNFTDMHPEENAVSPRNRTMNTIIESGADLVCLQETEIFGPFNGNKIHAEDMSLLNKLYPYIIRTGYYISFLSKYPVEAIHLDYKRKELGCDIGAYRVHIDDERSITVFNVHLQSLGLTYHDYDIYRDLTGGKTREISEIRELKSSLLSKVAAANVTRARQAEKLGRYIEHYGGPDVIVCGDFNDVSGCYSIHRLEDFGLREVYPEVGFGPIITYNARRFYFGIDHVLWRGGMKPLSLEKGRIASSDHFPLTVEFELTE